MAPIAKKRRGSFSCILTTAAVTVLIVFIFIIMSFLDLHRQTRDLDLTWGCQQTHNNVQSQVNPTFSSLYTPTVNNATSDPNPDMPWPRVAWLMSFPNSGTSYTMKLVSRASNRSVASNYGAECEMDPLTDTNRPLFFSKDTRAQKDKHNTAGPFLVHFTDRQLPNKYILTKTHCGSRCSGCSPSKYIETKESFMAMCSKGSIIYGKVNATTGLRLPKESHKAEVSYDPQLAQRAIHLIRNPFDNLVSNFHLERNEKKKMGRQDWLQRYPNTILGFKTYCQDLDSRHTMEESTIRFLPPSIVQLFSHVPCHAAFFIFIQWHNLALQVQHHLHLPTLYVYYEDYDRDWNGTTKKMFDFLDVTPVEENIPQFVRGKNYTEYYTESERNASRILMKRLADPLTFDLLRRYF